MTVATGTAEPVALRDGTTVQVRPIEPTDASALMAFHEGLSLESTRLRFFTPHPFLGAREVERFTSVDHDRREALVAIADDAIVAVARYDGLPDAVTAEVAFVVAEAWRGRGLASELLRRLADLAGQRGVEHLVADTLFENRAMASVFEHSGLPEHHSIEQGVLHFEMELPAPVAPEPQSPVT